MLYEWTEKWRPPSLSELTSMISNMGLTHLGSEASKYPIMVKIKNNTQDKIKFPKWYKFCNTSHTFDIFFAINLISIKENNLHGEIREILWREKQEKRKYIW